MPSGLRALCVYAGPSARAHLREHGLRPTDVRVIAAAAGGPKGLALLPLDQWIFGDWLQPASHPIDLIGASIGAWRLAAACSPDPVQALAQLGDAYIHERYGGEPGAFPPASVVTERFLTTLTRQFAGRETAIVSHPSWRLHVVVAQGRGLLRWPARSAMALGFASAVAANAVHRRGLDAALRRVCLSAGGMPPVVCPTDLPVQHAPLTAENLVPSVLASCTIPFWLEPVLRIPAAPPGPYWDGGLVDYHIHWPFHQLAEGFALVPHFQPTLIPGWLDKPWRWRHRATPGLDRAIVLAPNPEWVRTLPGGKLPDRSDFKRYVHNPQEREEVWGRALKACRQLADEWAEVVSKNHIDAAPLP